MFEATSETLLSKMRDLRDDDAWERFYSTYAPLITNFARSRGCGEQMAHDVLQETMIRLMRCMPGFRYDPSKGRFRAFLMKIVENRINTAIKRNARYCVPPADGTDPAGFFERLPDGAAKPAADAWDRLWEANLLRHAMGRVRQQVSPTTFESFERYVLKAEPVARIERKMGIKANTVYQHKNRVLRLLKTEVDVLKRELGES